MLQNSAGDQMQKTLMNRSADKLIKKAADCFDLAETQHHVAETQHESAGRQHCSADESEASARKLEVLGRALEADAAEIKGNNTEAVAREISVPPLPTAPAISSASRPSAKSAP
jgi:hypothetical protein